MESGHCRIILPFITFFETYFQHAYYKKSCSQREQLFLNDLKTAYSKSSLLARFSISFSSSESE